MNPRTALSTRSFYHQGKGISIEKDTKFIHAHVQTEIDYYNQKLNKKTFISMH